MADICSNIDSLFQLNVKITSFAFKSNWFGRFTLYIVLEARVPYTDQYNREYRYSKQQVQCLNFQSKQLEIFFINNLMFDCCVKESLSEFNQKLIRSWLNVNNQEQSWIRRQFHRDVSFTHVYVVSFQKSVFPFVSKQAYILDWFNGNLNEVSFLVVKWIDLIAALISSR